MISAARVDLYQLTSLVTHHAAGRADDRVVLTFFSRALPSGNGAPVRGFLLFAGLSRCLDHLERARFEPASVEALLRHPSLGPALAARPDLVRRLREWRFTGSIRAPREGTPLFAGKAVRADGTLLELDHGGAGGTVRPAAYAPYLEIETDLLSAKLVETPLLSTLNHMTMVASKAARVVAAAGGRVVLEFGTRRTHPEAAVDAALAAYIAGATATSNVEAWCRHGVPASGTMDHFAIQGWEEPGVPRWQTEEAFFRAFSAMYPTSDVMLVDTYDTFGDRTGIRAAVRATDGRGPAGIRLDSAVTRENVWRARRLLDELGATRTRIFVSGGLDEHAIAALGDAPADGFGIGERIVTSPDAPVGVGAVAKLSEVRGEPTMKLSRGSSKATLPGRLQVFRTAAGDVIGRADEELPGERLLQPVWTEADGRLPAPSLEEVRAHAARSIAGLAPELREPREVRLPVSDALAALVERLVRAGD